MNWDEMKEAWNRQPLPAWTPPDLAALEREFAAKQRKMSRGLFWRDVREAAAGVFVAGVFANIGWRMGRDGWPIAVAVLVLLGLSGFFVLERLRVRRRRLPADVSLLAKIDAEIAEQRRQYVLLSQVGWWYLGPCLLAAAIFGGTILAHAPVPKAPLLLAAAFTALVFALCGWGVIAINRRVVRKVIQPQLQQLEQWRQNLISSE
jgi:hypothetical protein